RGDRDHRRHADPAQRLPAAEAQARLVARYTGPVCRICRRESMKLFLKGEKCFTKCTFEKRSSPPGMHQQRRRKVSDFALQLREKQKARRMYGVLERQMKNTFDRAAEVTGATGETLLINLETRLDNTVSLRLRQVALAGAAARGPRPHHRERTRDEDPELHGEGRR